MKYLIDDIQLFVESKQIPWQLLFRQVFGVYCQMPITKLLSYHNLCFWYQKYFSFFTGDPVVQTSSPWSYSLWCYSKIYNGKYNTFTCHKFVVCSHHFVLVQQLKFTSFKELNEKSAITQQYTNYILQRSLATVMSFTC